MSKRRLDALLVERGLVETRSLAQRLVMAGQVRVDGQVVLKASTQVEPQVEILVDRGPPFVSRGGEKLAAALASFSLDVSGSICADVGASTGGFTDCLLQHGARRVYAIDVGRGILDWKLRQDERVVVMEGTNARFLEHLSELVDLATVDASFISLKLLLPVVWGWLNAIFASSPHRSWEIHPGRSPAAAHRHHLRPRDDRPGAGHHGSGTRERRNHQGLCGAHELHRRGRRNLRLNLIDTPGHVDFGYEVSRALAACEGASWWSMPARAWKPRPWRTCYMALEADLEIIPVINKIDLPSAHPDEVAEEIANLIG
jgi:TlyA family rRNA methyltransferase/putative hemolysin